MYKAFKYAFNSFVILLMIAAGYFSFAPHNYNTDLIKPLMAEKISAEQPVDLVVVLGAGLKTGGMLTDLAQERVVYAVAAAKERGKDILFSGGESPFGVEAHAMYEAAKQMGYEGPEHHEGSSSSTYENAYFSDLLLDDGKVPSDKLLIITSPYHSKRALATFEDVMPERQIFVDYPETTAVLNDSFLGRWRGLHILLREYLATYYYQIRFGIRSKI